MAGHNKWSKVKRIKEVADSKKGKLFTKLLREIQVASKLGGGDLRSNPRLRDAIDEARSNNMPKENIERAIKRGLGEIEGANYEQITYEAFGPAGTALLIECLTDNKNRTVADLRALLVRNHGNLGEAGSVSWMFEKKGLIIFQKNGRSENEIMEMVLDAGAEDLLDQQDFWEVTTLVDKLEPVKSSLQIKGIHPQSATQEFVPKNVIELKGEPAEQMISLIELLEDMDDVQKVYSNFEWSE